MTTEAPQAGGPADDHAVLIAPPARSVGGFWCRTEADIAALLLVLGHHAPALGRRTQLAAAEELVDRLAVRAGAVSAGGPRTAS